jgi:hypothetical protein
MANQTKIIQDIRERGIKSPFYRIICMKVAKITNTDINVAVAVILNQYNDKKLTHLHVGHTIHDGGKDGKNTKHLGIDSCLMCLCLG